jgi:hypothetical protein
MALLMLLLPLLPRHFCFLLLAGTQKLKKIMLGVAGRARHDRNKHRFLLPDTIDLQSWCLTPANCINLTRDHSSASENGVKGFFTDY